MSERHSMRKVREVLRLKYELGRRHREIAAAVGVARSTVSEYVARAVAAGLTWAIAKELGDAEVEARLFRDVGRNEPSARAPIDFNWVHMALRGVGVTRQLLWTEYQQAVAQESGSRPYQYSQFCELYEAYRSKLQPSMRVVHRAGEKAFLDYSGKKPRVFDAVTGEATEVDLFVIVLGASNYTYAEATWTQTLADFVGSTVRGLEYFGAVTEMLVPDQLRSAVKRPDRYEPEINETYAEMAAHYGTAVVPARPRRPKDKAKVEGGVLIAQRWILACLRNRRFFSLEELNAAIWELLEKLNTRPFQKLEGCRRSAFEKFDRPAMKPLPPRRYELGEWKLGVGVNIDYHFGYDDRFYSVPCTLMNGKVDARATATVVEVWHGGLRIASHERSYGPKGTAVTNPEHRPHAHREWGNWPPERLVRWAAQNGPRTAEVVAQILERRTHPETGRRACLGLMRLGERYGTERLEAASRRAVEINSPTYKSVQAILKTGFDKVALEREEETKTVVHENIRGGAYFDREELNGAPNAGEIEARYLEEERLSIMNDANEPPQASGSGSGDVSEGLEASSVALRGAAEPASPALVMAALPVLMARLRAAWTRPAATSESGSESTVERRGADSKHGLSMMSSCVILNVCSEDLRRGVEPMCDMITCEPEEAWATLPSPHRGEMS
jgi:transposase